mmetsp:Transcript_7444/g.23399  ORF Transcript_7444/g.23399 Transcript_7444/m.23399 type:complete len:381 (+) Transcript_7444:183-1325(+)
MAVAGTQPSMLDFFTSSHCRPSTKALKVTTTLACCSRTIFVLAQLSSVGAFRRCTPCSATTVALTERIHCTISGPVTIGLPSFRSKSQPEPSQSRRNFVSPTWTLWPTLKRAPRSRTMDSLLASTVEHRLRRAQPDSLMTRYHQQPLSTITSDIRMQDTAPGCVSNAHADCPAMSMRRNIVEVALQRSTTFTISPCSRRLCSFALFSYVGRQRSVTPLGSNTAYFQSPYSGSPSKSSCPFFGDSGGLVWTLRPSSVLSPQHLRNVWEPSRKSSTQPSKPTRRRKAPRRTSGRTRSTAVTNCPRHAADAGVAPSCGRGSTGSCSAQTSYCHSPLCTSTSTMRTLRSLGETSKTQPSPLESESHFVQPDLSLLSTSTTVPGG